MSWENIQNEKDSWYMMRNCKNNSPFRFDCLENGSNNMTRTIIMIIHPNPGVLSHPCLIPILVCQDCQTRILQTGWLKNTGLFPHSFGGWKFKVKVLAVWVSPEASPVGLQTATVSLCSHTSLSLCMHASWCLFLF